METLNESIILTKEELQGLHTRQDIIMNKNLEINLLQNESELYWLSLAKKYNLDSKKVFNVDKEGHVTEKKDVKNESKNA